MSSRTWIGRDALSELCSTCDDTDGMGESGRVRKGASCGEGEGAGRRFIRQWAKRAEAAAERMATHL